MTGPVVRPTRRIFGAVRDRYPHLDDDRGSLPMALLLIMVGMALAAALLPTMIVQDRATVFDGSRLDNLAAAQAGVDAVVGKIRASTTTDSSGTVSGNAAGLPCTTATNPIAGPVNSVGRARYSAVVSYYTVDPVANPNATPMKCVTGYGTYDTTTGVFVPSYAQITSRGTDGTTATSTTGASIGRTITSTYLFKVSNVNILNGQIRLYPSGSTNYCIDAGQAVPAIGAAVVMQPCSTSTPPLAQQLFAYRSDLTIQLSSSVTTANPNGLCLDFNTGTTNPAPAGAAGNPVRLSQCLAVGSSNVPYSQQWSYNDNGGFTASKSDSASTGNLSGQCMAVGPQTVGASVVLAACGDGSTTQYWLPAPSVGAGGAVYPQLINYQQFGRCLDISGQDVRADKEIAYPCKQNPQLPYPTAVLWNQKFTYDPQTQFLYTTYPNGTKYCLYSVETEGGFVRLTQCSNPAWISTQNDGVTSTGVPTPSLAQLQWTNPGNTITNPSNATATPYPQRYTFVDASTDATRCLSIADPTGVANPVIGGQWDYITTAACNGSTAQKWNADPSLGTPSLQNITETVGN